MRIRHIEVFHAVYTSGSVTRAAEILNVSQPSVSKVLAHAEQQLGYPLFERLRGKLVPTPEADRLYVHAVTVNDSLDRLRQVADNLRSAERGKIRVAATPAFGVDILPNAIAQYRSQYSDVVFSVETQHHDAICAALLASSIDLGLVFDPVHTAGIGREVLATGRFFVLAPPGTDFQGRSVLSLSDISKHPFIGLDRRGPLGQLLSSHIQSSGVGLEPVIWAETYQVAKALVAKGAGVTIADEVTAKSSDHRKVSVWPLAPELKFRVAVLRDENAPLSRVCKEFVDHLKHCVREYFLD
jgi:DNA-binding transcriptional LysR family regulator